MINELVNKMLSLTLKMQESILLDIEDIKQAKHENLLERNDEKEEMINEIAKLKSQLNEQLILAMKNGEDVNKYRDEVDNLESELKKLYGLNSELAAIVLPVQQMYKDIVDELTEKNGGVLFDVKA
ncbi:hypothetical protein CRU99_09970 [Malaciobacter mytili]|uniref:Uncharacterized protein n=1 Tax=Malaciobacter mytili LMG 24559 TaxID=1032238 RepID=A0AAX2AIZ8_9BACT|nr:hypothetical protein [Malaciobacter mytili]AXH15756.1 hypothetical protein AMYT_2211 [Malaciobacter mytili LMG 24559]RXI41166.1 hypothetical protein CRU99_09970 [Malaciobacter mytili]RXK15421.1 hypothetical protein CP985_08635 [Malaciobacter mytili LMG 24559]